MLENGQTYFKNLVEFPPKILKLCLATFKHAWKGYNETSHLLKHTSLPRPGANTQQFSFYKYWLNYKIYKGMPHATKMTYEHIWDNLGFQIN